MIIFIRRDDVKLGRESIRNLIVMRNSKWWDMTSIIKVDRIRIPVMAHLISNPLAKTIINQTGKTNEKRRIFLQTPYNPARSYSIHEWSTEIELPGDY